MIQYRYKDHKGEIKTLTYDLLEDAMRTAFKHFFYYNYYPISIKDKYELYNFRKMKNYWSDFYSDIYVA